MNFSWEALRTQSQKMTYRPVRGWRLNTKPLLQRPEGWATSSGQLPWVWVQETWENLPGTEGPRGSGLRRGRLATSPLTHKLRIHRNLRPILGLTNDCLEGGGTLSPL